MSKLFAPEEHPIAPTQVWIGLTAESQTCVIELLARLASNLVAHQLAPTSSELSPWQHTSTPSRSGPTTATASP